MEYKLLYIEIYDIVGDKMFEKFKKRSHQQKVTMKKEEKPKLIGVANKLAESQTKHQLEEEQKPIEQKKEPKEEIKTKETMYESQSFYENKEKIFAIKNYSSFLQLEEMINKEISKTKSKLGEYLLKIDKKRTFAEKSKKIRNAVYKIAEKNPSHVNQGEFEINGYQIILDAKPRHEIEALETVVKSYQDHLQLLQQTKEAIKEFDQLENISGVKFLVVEKYGVPKKILLSVP